MAGLGGCGGGCRCHRRRGAGQYDHHRRDVERLSRVDVVAGQASWPSSVPRSLYRNWTGQLCKASPSVARRPMRQAWRMGHNLGRRAVGLLAWDRRAEGHRVRSILPTARGFFNHFPHRARLGIHGSQQGQLVNGRPWEYPRGPTDPNGQSLADATRCVTNVTLGTWTKRNQVGAPERPK